MESVSDGPSGRVGQGRFAPGNRFASGNPQAKRMYELRRALLDSADPDRVKAVGLKMLELAESGDVMAARLILEYLLGKPPQALELSGPDGEPLGMDLAKLQEAILGALARFPEARIAVAVALKGAADASDAGHASEGA